MTTPKTDRHQLLSEKLDSLNQFKIDLGLGRLQQVLEVMGLTNPEATIFTVGGTNGKGSTVHALAALLSAAGKSYGAFTSPHIHRFNERINVNGRLAEDKEILAAFAAIDEARGEVQLSYFEYAFLAALKIFVDEGVDCPILEVGLGGRLDATNALDADVAIITTVDIDHTEWLGEDIESIATEKAGIMRAHRPVIYGDESPPKSITTAASKLEAPLLCFQQDYQLQVHADGFDYHHGQASFTSLPHPKLAGDWQYRNFAAALTAVLKLEYPVDADLVALALKHWYVDGRLQTIQQHPLVLADVAHNQQAASQLAQWLKDNPVAGQTRAVFSVLKDKHLTRWLPDFAGLIDHWMVFQLAGERAMALDEMKITLADHVKLFSQFDDGPTAYQVALSVSEEQDRIVVFGSFHVLDEVFK